MWPKPSQIIDPFLEQFQIAARTSPTGLYMVTRPRHASISERPDLYRPPAASPRWVD
jgi:hypothetical protein